MKMFPVMNTVILASTIIFLKTDTNLPIWGRDLQNTESKYICLFMSTSANGVEVYVSIKIISATKNNC